MNDRVLRVDPSDMQPESMSRAIECLRDGGLVVFPTETVYGIAVRSDRPDSIERLRAAKGRDADKPMAVHVGRFEQIERAASRLPRLAHRLIERYWPGPLTLVVPDRTAPADAPRTVGLRFPAHDVARALLGAIDVPVLGTSANRSGDPPACDAATADELIGDAVDIVLDGGPSELKEASTVVEILDDGWRLLREGFIDETAIRAAISKTVLFVCSGNTCRSPMAAAMFTQLLREHLGDDDLEKRGLRIRSAGTMAFPGSGASSGAIAAMQDMGIDLTAHETSPLTPDAIREADFVVAMTEEQLRAVRGLAPDAHARAALLDPTGHNTLDPFGGSLELYRKTAFQIKEHLATWLPLVLEAP